MLLLLPGPVVFPKSSLFLETGSTNHWEWTEEPQPGPGRSLGGWLLPPLPQGRWRMLQRNTQLCTRKQRQTVAGEASPETCPLKPAAESQHKQTQEPGCIPGKEPDSAVSLSLTDSAQEGATPAPRRRMNQHTGAGPRRHVTADLPASHSPEHQASPPAAWDPAPPQGCHPDPGAPTLSPLTYL